MAEQVPLHYSTIPVLTRGPGHACTGGSASASKFRNREPGVAPANPRAYGHTYKQRKSYSLAENESKVDCGAYGTEKRRGQ